MLTDKFPHLKGLILDMDGVLWRDTQPIGDLPALFRKISDLGLSYVFATNNATKTAAEYQEKLRGFGLSVKEEHISRPQGQPRCTFRITILKGRASMWSARIP